MVYELECKEVDAIIQSIDGKMEQDMITARKFTDEHKKHRFHFKIERVGDLYFTLDSENRYQFDKVEGTHTDVVCVTFNSFVQTFCGREWAIG